MRELTNKETEFLRLPRALLYSGQAGSLQDLHRNPIHAQRWASFRRLSM